jgi:hypothetical protein
VAGDFQGLIEFLGEIPSWLQQASGGENVVNRAISIYLDSHGFLLFILIRSEI